ncbi:Hsp20/alpha crystallin family protein [Treponema phagedenis]|uniref:Hsp20/alpha crystallin family protein n=1 Tax=Treponema phagedenis TaxID=162 RepID=UPI0001F63954|nr:Hsp20/alpha crystallin family protein [Treponema phagedenis]EFW36461.1 Hsp20/alpha crystallin family protein [Treponema phagedenis F0421]TYT79107.1 Hsp20/alpha crystallin family protein [Treponema phagedenis]
MKNLTLFNPSFTDSLFDAFDKGIGNLGVFAPLSNNPMPNVDVRETEKAYVMEIDLPGYTEKDVDLNLKDRTLTISSAKNDEKEEKKQEGGSEYIIRERSSHHFSRRFTLPEDIDTENVEASFKNGVLTIDIPRKKEAQPRQITIKPHNA